MRSIRYLFFIMLAVLLLLPAAAQAKSLYVIDNINADPTPISAYDIQGTALVFQATYNVPDHASGAVGLGIDSDSEFLFVTYEGGNVIELVNAKTMQSEGTTTAVNASNLAGIVVDQGKTKVYTVDRSTDHLYVYSWNAATRTLTLDGGAYKTLPNLGSAYGIALDETKGILYVADNSDPGSVKYYSTSDWTTLAGSFSPGHRPAGIAVDASRGYVYTGSWGSAGGSNFLNRWDLSAGSATTVDVGGTIAGVATDPQTGLVYITIYRGAANVQVYDLSLTNTYSTADIGNPTGLVVPGKDISFNPLNFTKSDGLSGGSVGPGDQITYSLCFDNLQNTSPTTGVTITDTVPANTTFVSASDGGTESAGVVTWNIGTLQAGAPQQCVTMTVQVDDPLPLGATSIDNTSTINSNETPQTTKTAETPIGGSGGACVNPGQSIVYSICFDNLQNTSAVTGVTITDTVPANTTFVSASGGGTESGGVVTWNIGTLQAGAARQCVTMTVLVDSPLPQGVTTIDNLQCTIDSNETPPTTQTFSMDVCKADVELTMDCNPTPAESGKSHSVIIGIDTKGETIGGLDLIFTFNPAQLTPTAASGTGMASGATVLTTTPGSGQFQIGLVYPSGFTGIGDVIQIDMDIAAGLACPLTIQVGIATGAKAYDLAGYELNANFPARTCDITLVCCCPDGDIAPLGNPDGKVNVGDAVVALRFALNLEPGHPTADELCHGDVAPLDTSVTPNYPIGDGKINVGDALVILRKALGLETWTCGNPPV